MLALHFLVEALEDLLQPFDVSAGLLEVRLERRSANPETRRLGQLRKSLGQLFLRVVRVAQLIEKCIVQGSVISHSYLLLPSSVGVSGGDCVAEIARAVHSFARALTS